MPGMNKIRVSNVTYADGEKYYDDLVLGVDNKTFLIDFVNGGGKTFLAQCIMQTILPKSHFISKHPFKELYSKENNNNTIHCLVEWKLESDSGYDYLITGFCSRKKENKVSPLIDNATNTSVADTFNYVCFYNEDSKYSIDKLPLKKVNEDGTISRMSYSNLRKFLRGLTSDSIGENYHAQIFDTTTEYHKLLRDYKINSSEWELIRDVNRGEAKLVDYFDKFTTSKSFIKDFLIQKIDESGKLNNVDEYQSGEDRAESLIAIKDTIVQYSKRIDSIKELDLIKKALESIVDINKELLSLFNTRNDIKTKIVMGLNRVNIDIEEQSNILLEIDENVEKASSSSNELENKKIEYQNDIKNLNNENISLAKSIKDINMYMQVLDVKDKEIQVNKLKEDLDYILNNLNIKENQYNDLKAKEEEYNAENKYMDYLDEKAELSSQQTRKSNFEKSHKELMDKLSLDGGRYKFLLSSEKKQIESLKESVDSTLSLTTESVDMLNEEKEKLIGVLARNHSLVEREEGSIERINKNIEALNDKANTIIDNIININSILTDKKDALISLNNDIQQSFSIEDDDFKKVLSSISKNTESLIQFTSKYQQKFNHDIQNINNFKNELEFILKSDDSNNNSIHISSLSSDLLDIQNEINHYEQFNNDVLQEVKELYKKLNNKIDDISKDIHKYDIDIASQKEKVSRISNDIEDYQFDIDLKQKEFDTYKKELSSIQEILDSYGTDSSVYTFEDILIKESKEKEFEIRKLNTNLGDLKTSLDRLKSNKGVVLSNELMNCLSILESKYNGVLLGSEFLKSISLEERRLYLDRTNSLIAYSILVPDSDYNKIINNTALLKDFKDELIPIINIDLLKKDKLQLQEGVHFTHRLVDEILDEERTKQAIEEKEKEISELIQSIESETSKHNELCEHLSYISAFNRKYNKDFEFEINDEFDILNEKLDEAKNNIEEITLEIESMEDKKNVLIKDMENLKNILQSIDFLNSYITKLSNISKDTFNNFNNISENYKTIRDVVTNINVNFSERETSLRSIKNYKDMIDDCTTKIELSETISKRLHREIVSLQDKSSNYKFDIKNFEKDIETLGYEEIEVTHNLSLNEAKSIFNHTLDDSRGKLSDLKVVDEYILKTKKSIDSIISEIKKYGYELSFFENKKCERHSDKDFLNLKEDIKDAKKSYNNQKSIYNEKEKEISYANGIIKNSIKTIETTFKVKYADIEVPDIDLNEQLIKLKKEKEDNEYKIDTFKDNLEHAEKEIKQIRDNILELNNKRSSCYNTLNKLNATKSQIDNFINNENIDVNMTKEVAEDIKYVTSGAKKDIELNKNRIGSVSKKHNDAIERTKSSLKNSTFNFVDDLSDVIVPKGIDDCNTQIQDIVGEEGYVYLLEEEKASLQGEIEELAQHQENFITLCVQRCEYALDKLLDIEEFSKVDIGGQKISAIKVVLNPLPDDERKIKMRNYITNIINDLGDSMLDTEKTKEIGKLLELKNLFPQILTDINKCVIKIFKINDTCDGGKYIKWGEAGSTGQTNSMFLYFFMCIIVFMRRLSAFNVKEDSRKLIILDSPFNGTVAINLWKIPLELMRKNNVQLMCLGYQVPAHLTGLFDIRYSLGQTKKANGVNHVSVIKEEALVRRVDSISTQDIIHGNKVEEIAIDINNK